MFRQIYGEVKYLCDEERKKRADEDGVSENEVEQEDCPGGYADLEAKGREKLWFVDSPNCE